jgi:acyl-CoA reductase-like NAD-dependent aldehyde dehydrogenase
VVHSSKKEEFVASLKKYIEEFYGKDPSKSPDYARIVNDRNFERVSRLLNSGRVIYGGETDAEERYVAPTLLEGVSFESDAMQEEV